MGSTSQRKEIAHASFREVNDSGIKYYLSLELGLHWVWRRVMKGISGKAG